MYQSPLDRFASRLRQAEIGIRNARRELNDSSAALHGVLPAELETRLAELQTGLEGLCEEVATLSLQDRTEYARDRAWALVQLRKVGGLLQPGYYELAQFCNPLLQEQMAFNADLRAELESPELIQDILDNTVFTFCAGGVFQW